MATTARAVRGRSRRPGERHRIEFCESGAKAVAEEATSARVDDGFFARHSLGDLQSRSDYWLGEAGRLTAPMIKRPGGTHYQPIGWEEAFVEIAAQLRGLDCHEPTSFALAETIGVGKGSVHLDAFARADLIVIVGQNPGSNHPRMLTTLEAAKRSGAKIIAINPLPEAGLLRYRTRKRSAE